MFSFASFDGNYIVTIDGEPFHRNKPSSIHLDHVEPWSIIRQRLRLIEYLVNFVSKYRQKLFEMTIVLVGSYQKQLKGKNFFTYDKNENQWILSAAAIEIFYNVQENLVPLTPHFNVKKSDKDPLKFFIEKQPELFGKLFLSYVRDKYQVDFQTKYQKSTDLFFFLEDQNGKAIYFSDLLREFRSSSGFLKNFLYVSALQLREKLENEYLPSGAMTFEDGLVKIPRDLYPYLLFIRHSAPSFLNRLII